MDTMTIEVLPDGTIKTITDRISMPNHANAEAFLRETSRLAGGVTTRKGKHGHAHAGHYHEHTHDHDHEHQH